MRKIILLIIGFLSTICISFASVAEYDNLIDKYTNNPSERAVLKYIMRMESMGNSNAKNPSSTATGAWQITKDIWKDGVKLAASKVLISNKEKILLQSNLDMRKNFQYSTKVALALIRSKKGSPIQKILAYHDGSCQNDKNPTGTFDGATLEENNIVFFIWYVV